MQIPKVSIVVPCYNVDKYLDRCLKSIVNQTLREVEIILVDDKSPGIVPVMCDEWAKRDSRIKVVHKECNEGLGFARNSGLEVANGEYVAFVDSDDFVELNMYERLYSEAKCSDADVVYCNFFYSSGNKNIKVNEVVKECIWNDENIYRFKRDLISSEAKIVAEHKYHVSVWHALYKNTVIKSNNIKFVSERNYGAEDLPFQISFLNKASKVIYTPNAYYHYCVNQSSLTHTFNPVVFDSINNLMKLLLELVATDNEAKQRVFRYVSSEHRAQILRLLDSNYENKLFYIVEKLRHPVWKDLSNYSPSNYPLYPRVFHFLCINDYPTILYVYAKGILLLKKLKKYL